MIRSLKVGLKIELTNRKNLFLLLIVALITVGMMFYIKSQSAGNQIIERTGDFYSAQAALTKFQVVDASDDGDGSDLYKNLNKQKIAVALQIAALKMKKDDIYYKTSIEIAELRAKAFDLEDYDKVASLMPSRIKNTLNHMYFTHLLESKQAIAPNPLELFPFLLFFFSIVGAGWYVFISFYTSSILLDDFEHSSLIKGYPIRFDQYILTKCVTHFLYIVAFIVVVISCAMPLLFLNGAGDANYPIAVYVGEPSIYSTIHYVAISIGYMIVIAVFSMLLSIILNVLLKNMYLTLFVQSILFFLPEVFSSMISFMPYNPFNFLNFNKILSGYPLELATPVDITMTMGLIILLVCIVLMLLVIKTFFSTGKIARA
ncbi:ABC transporter [Metasolibacillus meyeri]|uniref:ABC transporter n=1 Tax=Metasolibacillus meyeri TaxID=1071052 RepID=A0AAW9NWA8_9BACL|nr:ABC transporter [Metasolibacillus meyeri]MEC1179566.1 ABC transporter [Metasolibacillus meyeri]